MALFVGASESYDADAWEAYSLKKENAKLRNRVEELESYVTAPPLEEQLLEALDKNKKLREWAQDMLSFYFTKITVDRNQREASLLKRAHELGVKDSNGELGVEVAE